MTREQKIEKILQRVGEIDSAEPRGMLSNTVAILHELLFGEVPIEAQGGVTDSNLDEILAFLR